MSYLDIDLILSEEERIPCVFNLDAEGLGSLDASVESEDLPSGSRVELPLWLAESLFKKSMVKTELPKHYGQKMRDEILAGALNIDLKSFSYYFFEVGIKLSKESNNKDLRRILAIAFSSDRFRSLMVHSLSSWNDDVTTFAQNLTAAELLIFNEGKCLSTGIFLCNSSCVALKTSRDLHEWRSQRSNQLKSTSLLGRRTNEYKEQDSISSKRKL